VLSGTGVPAVENRAARAGGNVIFFVPQLTDKLRVMNFLRTFPCALRLSANRGKLAVFAQVLATIFLDWADGRGYLTVLS
jgi:hypothetical protein